MSSQLFWGNVGNVNNYFCGELHPGPDYVRVGRGGIAMVMKAGQRDSVSTARQGWIQRRSEKDSEEW